MYKEIPNERNQMHWRLKLRGCLNCGLVIYENFKWLIYDALLPDLFTRSMKVKEQKFASNEPNVSLNKTIAMEELLEIMILLHSLIITSVVMSALGTIPMENWEISMPYQLIEHLVAN